jgi:hypothetical protein
MIRQARIAFWQMLYPAAWMIVVLPSPRPREHIMIQETSAQDLARRQIQAAFAADWPYDFLGDHIVSERNYWDNAALQAQLG